MSQLLGSGRRDRIGARVPGEAAQARDAWIRALQRTGSIDREPQVTLPVLIGRLADGFGDAPALVSPEATLTYRELARKVNRYARWAASQGLDRGGTVAMLVPNCAEYLPIWLGITRVGASVALLNTHLTGDSLAHAVRIVSPQHLVVDASLAAAAGTIRARLPAGLIEWSLGDSPPDRRSLTDATSLVDDAPLPAAECALPSLDERALYIYTSGTTGLPKAANVSHYRVMQWSHWFAGLLDTRTDDRMYNCLPLYHSVGGVVATGATLLGGGTVVLRPGFSASDFWRDVRAERCTLFQYIGELCRYLVNGSEQPGERDHRLRIACGNGLRPEVWERFQQRFAIPRILEYYAATEGNFSLYNCEGRPGSIGRIPGFLSHRLPVALVRFDVASGEPLRDAAGRCVRCAADEVGEAIGFVPESAKGRTGRFEGYADTDASARKLLRNVFADGDAWYRTGDLMRRDAEGFFYFVDRVGETFRWKGENVSTTEVLAALSACPGVIDGVVYGVEVPGYDGRAGMAALVVADDFDPAGLGTAVAARLPEFARPVFIRLLPALQATRTFKPQKHLLAGAGFDPGTISDPLLYAERPTGRYVPLGVAQHAAIIAGTLRL